MPGTHCYMPLCKNRSNGNVINDHFRAKKLRFTSARHVLRYVITKTRAQIKIKSLFFYLILWLFDFSALLYLLAFASSSCLIYKFISSDSICVTMHVVKNWCIKCCHWWRMLHGSSFKYLTHCYFARLTWRYVITSTLKRHRHYHIWQTVQRCIV